LHSCMVRMLKLNPVKSYHFITGLLHFFFIGPKSLS